MERYLGCIAVEDGNGCRLQLHEYRQGFFLRTRRYVLDSGETVLRIDSETFEIAATREKLVRVES